MQYILIRHGKTDANRLTRAAFGAQGAPLNAVGISQAQKLQTQLIALGIDVETATAAVSTLQRTTQTAQYAGLKSIHAYQFLNEVKTADPEHTQQLIEQRQLPPEAIQAAKNILANPPTEKIWVTHGLVIAALLQELGQSKPNTFIPDFCSITNIDF